MVYGELVAAEARGRDRWQPMLGADCAWTRPGSSKGFSEPPLRADTEATERMCSPGTCAHRRSSMVPRRPCES